jgi:hypothetical protein
MKADTAIHSDIDALTALNRDYIQSVQDGDVRRLDKILSDDFLCSNPDGSLVDKKQFLAQTAPPGRVFGEFTMLGSSCAHPIPRTTPPLPSIGFEVSTECGGSTTGSGCSSASACRQFW